jgi:hypothetical protein
MPHQSRIASSNSINNDKSSVSLGTSSHRQHLESYLVQYTDHPTSHNFAFPASITVWRSSPVANPASFSSSQQVTFPPHLSSPNKMAVISSTPTQIEVPRAFHPFPQLPLELRLKIWGIRFADSTRIVDFNISPNTEPVRTLHLTHNAKLPFRACKEERNESLRIFNMEADVCSKLKPLEFKWPYPELDDLPIPGVFDACQIRYPRDIA